MAIRRFSVQSFSRIVRLEKAQLEHPWFETRKDETLNRLMNTPKNEQTLLVRMDPRFLFFEPIQETMGKVVNEVGVGAWHHKSNFAVIDNLRLDATNLAADMHPTSLARDVAGASVAVSSFGLGAFLTSIMAPPLGLFFMTAIPLWTATSGTFVDRTYRELKERIDENAHIIHHSLHY